MSVSFVSATELVSRPSQKWARRRFSPSSSVVYIEWGGPSGENRARTAATARGRKEGPPLSRLAPQPADTLGSVGYASKVPLSRLGGALYPQKIGFRTQRGRRAMPRVRNERGSVVSVLAARVGLAPHGAGGDRAGFAAGAGKVRADACSTSSAACVW
jgi:hypothetical protein